MSYTGYLIKVGEYDIPTDKFIRAQSYKATLSVMDLDSFRDADGVLHRTALSHRVNKIEFETPMGLTNIDMAELFGNIAENYTVPAERKFVGTFYVPELDDYVSQDMYMVDPAFNMHSVTDKIIQYKPVRIAFIAY